MKTPDVQACYQRLSCVVGWWVPNWRTPALKTEALYFSETFRTRLYPERPQWVSTFVSNHCLTKQWNSSYVKNSQDNVYCFRNVVAQCDAREGKWRGNWRMEGVTSTLTPPRQVVYPALLPLMRTPRLPAADWTDSPADLNGLVCLGARQNVVSARVPSGSSRALPNFSLPVKRKKILSLF